MNMCTIRMVTGLDGYIIDGIVRIDTGSTGWGRTWFPVFWLGWDQFDLEILFELWKIII